MTFYYGLTYLAPGMNIAKPVPLQNVRVEANVVDMIAEVTISQTYKNVESVTIEAIYKFPVHEAAAICEFEAEIDGNRTVKGVVKEAQQAVKEYDEAVQSGLGAYLLQQQLPDVFQCSIGNITPNQTVTIRITYVTELKQDSDSDQIRFVLPTAVAPRYGEPEKNPFQSTTQLIEGNPPYSSETQYTLDLNVTCRMTASLLSVESPTHKIKTEINLNGDPKTCRVGLAEERTHLENDFVLIVKSTDLDKSRAFTEYDSKTKTNCTMLTLVPTFELKPVQTEMIFVVDRSGSMSGAPIIKARQTLELILRSLPSNCFLNVVSFGSSYSALFEKSVPYSETSYNTAIQHAQVMEANFGGTELLSVLKWVLENKSKELPTAVFLLTDGEVWNVDQIAQLVENKVKEAKDTLRLFSLGIGSSVSHNLVETVARAGKGYAQFVSNEERMDKKVAGMVKNAIRPPLTDYKISWVDTESSDPGVVKYRQAPFVIPPLYQGVRYIVYALFAPNFEPARDITITMKSRSGPVEVTVPIDPIILDGNKIHILAARKLIQDLEDKRSYLHNDPKNEGKEISTEDTKSAIVKLAIEANLASKYTSFLAIDERDQTLSTAEIQKRVVPVRHTGFLLRAGSSFTGASAGYSSFGSSLSFGASAGSTLTGAPAGFGSSSSFGASAGSALTGAPAGFGSSSSFGASAGGFGFGGGSSMFSKSSAGFGSSPSFGAPASDLIYEKSALAQQQSQQQQQQQQTIGTQQGVQLQKVKQERALRESSGPVSESLFGVANVEGTMATVLTNKSVGFDPKLAEIETLYGFIRFQSFDGFFKPTAELSEFFSHGKDTTLFQNKDQDSVWSTCIALAYLEIVMKGFKEEWELCYEKAQTALDELSGYDAGAIEKMMQDARKWVTEWYA